MCDCTLEPTTTSGIGPAGRRSIRYPSGLSQTHATNEGSAVVRRVRGVHVLRDRLRPPRLLPNRSGSCAGPTSGNAELRKLRGDILAMVCWADLLVDEENAAVGSDIERPSGG